MRRPTNKGHGHTFPTMFMTRPGHRHPPKVKTRKESQSTGKNHSSNDIAGMATLMGRKVR